MQVVTGLSSLATRIVNLAAVVIGVYHSIDNTISDNRN